MITKKEISIFDGIRALIPDAKFYVEDNSWDKIFWDDKRDQPTRSQIETKIKELETEYEKQSYARARKKEYPELSEQLDMIYWDKKNGTKNWESVIDKVKADNPKPE